MRVRGDRLDRGATGARGVLYRNMTVLRRCDGGSEMGEKVYDEERQREIRCTPQLARSSGGTLGRRANFSGAEWRVIQGFLSEALPTVETMLGKPRRLSRYACDAMATISGYVLRYSSLSGMICSHRGMWTVSTMFSSACPAKLQSIEPWGRVIRETQSETRSRTSLKKTVWRDRTFSEAQRTRFDRTSIVFIY